MQGTAAFDGVMVAVVGFVVRIVGFVSKGDVLVVGVMEAGVW